jgi:excisionase family DNA binding protein
MRIATGYDTTWRMSNLALQTAVASLFGGLLTCQQVAEILRVHPRTVQRLERTGALRGIRLGRRAVRFRREDIQSFIESSATI